MANSQLTPWKDGYYKFSARNTSVFIVTGESVEMESVQGKVYQQLSKSTWKYGDFGKAHPELTKHTGKSNYNVDMNMADGLWLVKGILSDDGLKIFTWTKDLAIFEWITEDEYIAKKNFGDPWDAPPNHYKIQPENDGKLLFISGAPGLGKSTCGLMLSKMAGYVYYEGDAFSMHVNPYIPPDAEEPSMATLKQKPLLGLPQERLDAVANGIKDLVALLRGQDYDRSNLEGYYTELCKNIMAEKKRLGGDWVVTQAVPSRDFRDFIKKQIGTKAVFMVLNMSKEDQIERLEKRHGKEQSSSIWLAKTHEIFEPAAKDEEQAINIRITNNMSREDIARMIIDNLPK